jgi:CMP-N-acetylneuraminic acid synthetase
LGLVTARGGSKGLPGKNLRPLAGKPLLSYTVKAARDSGVLDRIVLSTDDDEIAAVGRSFGCEVPFMRPADLARDETPHLPVVQHAVRWLGDHQHYVPDAVMILQPTSPFRLPDHIGDAVKLLESSGADSVVGVCAVPDHVHPMRTVTIDASGITTLFVTGEPLSRRINRRQDMPPAWTINGAVYLLRTPLLFAAEPGLYGDRVAAYVMPPTASVSIDSLEDWLAAERVFDDLLTEGPAKRA